MPELNFISTDAQDTTGSKGLVQQPYLATTTPGYNYGGAGQPTGDGFLEYGTGTPGSLPFRVDQAGNVTAASITGATGTTDWLNVKAYGATGNGTTDDTAAIQAALTAAQLGQVVYFPAGRYLVSSPVVIPPWVTVMGSGIVLNGSYRTDYPSTLVASASFSGGSWPVTAVILMVAQALGGYSVASAGQAIVNIGIDCTSAPASVDGIDAYGSVNGNYFQNIYIGSPTGNGLSAIYNATYDQPDGWRMNGIMVAGAGGNGFQLTMADVVANDLHAIGCGGDGFSCIGLANSQLSNCRMANNTGNGWNFGRSGSGTASAGTYITLTGCNSQLNGKNGLLIDWPVQGGQSLILEGFTSVADGLNGGSGGGSYAGVNVTSAGTPIVFDGLYVIPGTGTQTAPEYGLSVTDCSYLMIRGGVIQGYTQPVFNGGSNGVIQIDPSVLTGTGLATAPTFNTLPATLGPAALPSDHGLLAWNFDPSNANTATIMASESLYVMGLYIRTPMKVSKIWLAMTTGASSSGFTAAGLGLYSVAGGTASLLSGTGTSATTWETGGVQPFTLTTAQLVQPGFYIVAGFNEATTPATLRNGGGGSDSNAGITTAAAYRFAVNGTSVTSLPSSITLSANSTTGLIPAWAGVS